MTGRQALLLCGKKELGNTFLGVNINCHTSFSILSKLFPTVNYPLRTLPNSEVHLFIQSSNKAQSLYVVFSFPI